MYNRISSGDTTTLKKWLWITVPVRLARYNWVLKIIVMLPVRGSVQGHLQSYELICPSLRPGCPGKRSPWRHITRSFRCSNSSDDKAWTTHLTLLRSIFIYVYCSAQNKINPVFFNTHQWKQHSQWDVFQTDCRRVSGAVKFTLMMSQTKSVNGSPLWYTWKRGPHWGLDTPGF